MESLDLTYMYKLIALKIKSKAHDRNYFMSHSHCYMRKGENKKIKITKMYLFLLLPLPSQNVDRHSRVVYV